MWREINLSSWLQHRNLAWILTRVGLSWGSQTQQSSLNFRLLACPVDFGLASTHNKFLKQIPIPCSSFSCPFLLLFSLLLLPHLCVYIHSNTKRDLNGQWEEKKISCFRSIFFVLLNISTLIHFYLR